MALGNLTTEKTNASVVQRMSDPRIHRVESPPEYTIGEWEPGDIGGFPDDCEVAAYWYSSGSYCGAGQVVCKIGGLWRHVDLGHCSCTGPEEELRYGLEDPVEGFKTLEGLQKFSHEMLRLCSGVIEHLKKLGYQ